MFLRISSCNHTAHFVTRTAMTLPLLTTDCQSVLKKMVDALFVAAREIQDINVLFHMKYLFIIKVQFWTLQLEEAEKGTMQHDC